LILFVRLPIALAVESLIIPPDPQIGHACIVNGVDFEAVGEADNREEKKR
jgi:hypothetical protein